MLYHQDGGGELAHSLWDLLIQEFGRSTILCEIEGWGRWGEGLGEHTILFFNVPILQLMSTQHYMILLTSCRSFAVK